MADVFLSYSHNDEEAIEPLVRLLEDRGLTVWWDRSISIGRDLNTIIDQQLDEAGVVVVVWSESSVSSTWVRAEADDALAVGKLVPVAIEPVRYPLPFRMCETAELHGWPNQDCSLGISKLLRAIETSLMKGAGKDAPLPIARSDPSLSLRVARRVATELFANSSSLRPQADARVDMESALADASLMLLEGTAWKPLPESLLHTMNRCIPGMKIAVYRNQDLLWGDRQIEPLPGTNAEYSDPKIDSKPTHWAFTVADEDILLCALSQSEVAPPTWLADRLHAGHRVLVHWLRQRNG